MLDMLPLYFVHYNQGPFQVFDHQGSWLHRDQPTGSHTPHGLKSQKEGVLPEFPPKFLVVNVA